MTTNVKPDVKPVVNSTPAPATEVKVTERALAMVGGQQLTLPSTLESFSDSNGNLLTTKRWLQKRNNLPDAPKQKLTDLKKAIGDHVKVQIKEYNAAKIERRQFDSKVWALVGADATLRKSVKAVVNAKGTLIGFNGSARFTKDADTVGMLMDEVTKLRNELAALVNAKQPALPAKA